MKRTGLLILTVLLALALGFTGCSKAEEPAAQAAPAEKADTAAPAAEAEKAPAAPAAVAATRMRSRLHSSISDLQETWVGPICMM